MPSTYTCLLYHFVFSTKNREPLIIPAYRERLHEYLGGVVRGLDGVPKGVGGVVDHVHLLALLRPTHCVADFMREMKKASSLWMASIVPERTFRWQEGYAAFSVSASCAAAVQHYIARQEEHHRSRSFREELVALLQRSGVEFDERFLD
jgi:putative transposase